MSVGTARTVMLKVDEDLCRACRRCLATDICRGNAFRRFERDEAPFIDMSRCWGCMECIPECPFEAIVRHEYERK